MPVPPNLTPEQRKILEQLRKAEREAKKLPSPSKAFQAEMNDQTATHAKLAEDSSVHDRVRAMFVSGIAMAPTNLLFAVLA